MKEEERKMEEGTLDVEEATPEAESDQHEKVALLVDVDNTENLGEKQEEVLVVEDEDNGHGNNWTLKNWKI